MTNVAGGTNDGPHSMDLAKANPKVDISAYIDDFQIVVAGTRSSVMQRAADALIDLERVIKEEVKCCLHEEKANITATDPKLEGAIKEACKRKARGEEAGSCRVAWH